MDVFAGSPLVSLKHSRRKVGDNSRRTGVTLGQRKRNLKACCAPLSFWRLHDFRGAPWLPHAERPAKCEGTLPDHAVVLSSKISL